MAYSRFTDLNNSNFFINRLKLWSKCRGRSRSRGRLLRRQDYYKSISFRRDPLLALIVFVLLGVLFSGFASFGL